MTPDRPGRWSCLLGRPPREVVYQVDLFRIPDSGALELAILGEEALDGSLVPHTQGMVKDFTELMEAMGWGKWMRRVGDLPEGAGRE